MLSLVFERHKLPSRELSHWDAKMSENSWNKSQNNETFSLIFGPQ